MRRHFAGCELNHGRERCLCDARRYLVGIALSGVIVLVYLVGAALSESLALAAESGHALVDALIAYGWAIFVDWRIYHRSAMEVRLRRLGSILNGVFFLAVGGMILAGVLTRDIHHIDNTVLGVAAVLGVALNAAQYWVIGHGEGHQTNVQLNLHNLGDIFQGLAVIAASIVIAFTGWEMVDRIVATLMAVWFVRQGLGIILSIHDPRAHSCHHH